MHIFLNHFLILHMPNRFDVSMISDVLDFHFSNDDITRKILSKMTFGESTVCCSKHGICVILYFELNLNGCLSIS